MVLMVAMVVYALKIWSEGNMTVGEFSMVAGLAIMLTVLIFNTLGDWLRDTLDPRLKLR